MINIGNYRLKTNILLAPLSGCADLPFRLIMREYGAKFCFFEMIDANALQKNKKSLEMLKTTTKDRPIAGQLVGSDPDIMLSSAKEMIKHADIKFLDVNAACPVRKVIKKKAGAYLLKEPILLYKIIKKLSSNLDLPITVKLRIGYDRIDNKNIADISAGCEHNGASAIFVHGRTRTQGYSGPVEHSAIRSVKNAVSIPVFGSGNIFTPEQAKEMMEKTGCDGIIVARGAFGNPWIFKNILNYIKGKPLYQPTPEDRKKAAVKHIKYIMKYNASLPKGKIGLMRKAALWYMKSFHNAACLRKKINCAKSAEELIDMINSAECH